jgi:hypothetical protein
MPRTEARVFTSIWKDADFLALPPTAQRLYMFLLSQPELSYCGVMPLRPPRWVPKAAGLTLADVEQDLKALETAGRIFVVTDHESGELLVRSMMRRDNAWKQPNLLKQALDSATEIESPKIRAALLAEVRRLPVDDSPSEQVRTLIAELINDLAQGNPYPPGYPNGQGPDHPDDEGTDKDHARARETGGSYNLSSQEVLLAPDSDPSLPRPDRKLGHRLPDDWLPTRELVEWARRECTHVDSRRETERFSDYWHAKPGKDGRKLDWAKTWKNWMRTAEDRQGPRERPGKQQDTDDKFDRALQRAQSREGILDS